MLGSSVFLVVACALSTVYGYGGDECQTDDCLKAVIGTKCKPCLYRCKSFMKATVTPTPSTVYTTVTESATDYTTDGVVRTDTNYITVTSTTSEIATVTSGITQTQFTSITATATITTTVTSQEYKESYQTYVYKRDTCAQPPARLKRNVKKKAKREDDSGLRTRYPTCMATKIINACSNAAAYSSACLCVGVTATTITKPRATTTKTTTVTDSVGTVRQSTSTTTRTITGATDYQTVRSSSTVRVTVTTVTSETIVATVTKTVTTTVARSVSSSVSSSASSSSSAPPIATQGVSLHMLSGPNGVNYGFNDLDAQTAPFMGFRDEPEAEQKQLRWSINPQTGGMTLVNYEGPEAGMLGQTLFYRPDGVGSSYVILAWEDYELDDRGVKPVSCSIVGPSSSERLQCKYNDQIADMWICEGDLKLTRPGFDLPQENPECARAAQRGTIYVTRP